MYIYTLRSPEKEVDQYLINTYRLSLIQFERTIGVINNHLNLLDKKRSLSSIRKDIEYLESSKEALIKKIDEFIIKSKIWSLIGRAHSELDISSAESRAVFIKSEFRLGRYFDFIERRVRRLKEFIKILTNVDIASDNRRKMILPKNLLVLVWTIAFTRGGASNRKSYQETALLLKWFSKNRIELLRKFCGQLIRQDQNTIRRTYERYVIKPKRENRVYKELAVSLYLDGFEYYE